MPVFSRARIINVSYDFRYIDDCLFNFYDGCDTLMNLANGSGKTVMVEVLFQPIIPNMKIGKWKITDYLTGDSRPTFVLIEWKLDNTKTPEYLLTGICLSIARQDSDDTQSQRSLKYFTFTHHYSRGNEYDISNIPLTEPIKDGKRVPTYNEIYDLIKAYARSHSEFDFFSKDKAREYKQKLSEYYIFHEEWKLLERVNQAESGVGLSSLFEQCKTSDELFDNWILRTVSDTDRDQRKSLIEAIPELVEPIFQSDESLSEKQLYEELQADLSSFETCFRSYIDVLDSKEKHEDYMSGILSFIYSMISQETIIREHSSQIIEECKEKERRIEYEHLSEEYHDAEREMVESQKRLDELTNKLPLFQRQKEDSEHEYRCMAAAKIYENIKRAREALTAEQNTMAAIKNNEQSRRIIDVGFTLYKRYEEYILHKESQYNDELQHLKRVKEDDNLLSEKNDTLSRRFSELVKSKGKLEILLEQFEAFKEKCLKQLGSLPDENLLGELDAQSTTLHRDMLQQEVTDLETSIQDKKAEKESLQKTADDAIDTLDSVKHDIIETEHMLEDNDKRHHEFSESYKEQKELLLSYGIAEMFVYDRQNNFIRLNEMLSDKKKAADKEKLELSSLEEKLRAFRENRLYVSPEFDRFLTESGIDFQTGEAYLKAQSEEFQQTLLSDNPLLPYCFIVNDTKNYERAITITSEMFADRICPLICRQSLDRSISRSDREAWLEPLRLFALYDSKSFSPDSKDNYEKDLLHKIEKKKGVIDSLERSIYDLNNAIITVKGFAYTLESEQSIISEKDKLISILDGLKKKKNDLEKSRKAALEQIKKLEKDLKDFEKSLQSAYDRQQCLNNYIVEAQKAYKNRADAAEIQKELDEVQSEQNSIKKKKEDISSQINDCIRQCTRLENEKASGEKEKEKYAAYTDGGLVDGEIGQLVYEYDNLHTQYSEKLSQCVKECKRLQKEIDDDEKEIQQQWPELKPDDYKIEYDQSRLKYLGEQFEKSKEALTKAEADYGIQKMLYEKCKKESENCRKKLNSRGYQEPLSKREILGNYEKRSENCKKEKASAESSKRDADNRLSKLSFDKNKIERYVDAAEKITQVTDDIVLDDVIERLKQLRKQAETQRKTVNSEYGKLNSKYALRSEFAAKVVLIDNFENNESYSKCYYSYERLMEKQKFLQDEIQLLNTKLENVAASRMHIVEQVKRHAEFLYSGVRIVSQNSSVNLHGKSQRVLEIQIPDSIDRQMQSRIENMVDDALSKLRTQVLGSDYSVRQLSASVDGLFSDRAIFNAYIGENTIKIRVWKELEDSRNSRLVTWGERFSGGESFITYIIMYSVLAAYARSRRGSSDRSKIRSVFLVDNPFGEASSVHLLETLAGVTKKFDLQLVCLSALNQESITRNFDLIYQLSMHRAIYSKKSLLKIDKTAVLNQDATNRTSVLDYVSLRSSQLTLF